MTNNDKNEKNNYKNQIKEAFNDLKTPGKRYKQIPNILTASRLFSPFLIIPAAIIGNTAFAAYSAIAFGFTDLIDGALARKLKVKSELGADLDAFSDKMFAGSLLIGGAIFNPILSINIILEMVIASINLTQKFSGNKAGSTLTGKIKTWGVFALGALGIIAPNLSLTPALIPTIALTTATMQLLTIESYLKKYNKKPKEKEEKEIEPPIEESPKEEPLYGENKMPILYKEKIKDYVQEQQNLSLEEKNLQQEKLEELRELASFFETPKQEEKPKVYQKTTQN